MVAGFGEGSAYTRSSACEEAVHSGFRPSETSLSEVFVIRDTVALLWQRYNELPLGHRDPKQYSLQCVSHPSSPVSDGAIDLSTPNAVDSPFVLSIMHIVRQGVGVIAIVIVVVS